MRFIRVEQKGHALPILINVQHIVAVQKNVFRTDHPTEIALVHGDFVLTDEDVDELQQRILSDEKLPNGIKELEKGKKWNKSS